MSQQFVFLAKTDEELSLVCETRVMPKNTLTVKHHWKALRIAGELDFSLVGILATITTLLAEHHISIFALSTFTTDYILVQKDSLEKAIDALNNNGHRVERM